MKTMYTKIASFAFISLLLLSICGCQGGGGGDLGSFFVGGDDSYADSGGGDGGGIIDDGGGGGIDPIVNPEPTSVLLLGSGLVAMAFYANRKKSKK